MSETRHELPLVARQKLVERVIDRLLRPDDLRSSPKEFIQPGFYGVAGIGKSRLLHAIRDQALTVTPYVVAFDFDRRHAVDVPGTPWGFVLRLIEELASIDRQHRHWWQRMNWGGVNPFRECEAIIANTGAPTAISQSVVAADSAVSDVSMTVESMVQPIPLNLQKAFVAALARLGVRGRVRREYEAALGASPRPLIVILLDTVEMAPKPIRQWLSEGLTDLLAGNTLGFHAVIVAAGRQQIPNLISTQVPDLTPVESVQFLVNYFVHRSLDDARLAAPELQHLLRDETPTRAAIIELAAGIPLLLQILADLVADNPYRPFVLPEGPSPVSQEARIDYVIQHYIERLVHEAPDDKARDDEARAQRRRLLLYGAVPRRIPNDGLLHALFADLPGAPMPGDSRTLFTRLERESFVRSEPPAGLVYHEIMRSGFLRHLERAEPQRWRELQRRAATWWETLPDAAETLYHRLRADYAGTVEPMKEAIDAALAAQNWPQAQALIGVAADLELQPADVAWLTLFKAELAWGEGNLPLVHRRVERLCAQPDLPPDLAERLAADLERWFHFAPEMTPEQVKMQNQQRVVWVLWYARRRSTPALYANALIGLGEAARMQDRSADAERHYQEALAVYRQIADRLGEANALIGLGDAALMQARSADAERHYQEALAVYRQIAYRLGEANALIGLGDAARMQARSADAERHYQEALAVYRQIADRLGEANALRGLGEAARMQDRSADAERHYQEALAVYRQIADRLGEANALRGLGDAARMQDRSADAERHYQEALAVYRQIAYRLGEANALIGLGDAARMQARSADAERHYQEALAVYRQIADRLGEANALRGLGEAARMQDRSADAERHYQEALAVYRQIADRLGEANALRGLGDAARMQDRSADAERHYQEALAVYRQIAYRLGEANALIGLGEAARMQDRSADAERHYQEALAVYRQIADRLGEANALRGLGEAARMQARFADARSYLVQAFDLYDSIRMPQDTLRFAISIANAALDQAQPQPGTAYNPALARQSVELARWLLARAENASTQCDPAIATAYTVHLQALRLRIANL